METRCCAPCIVNVSRKFYVTFCERPLGHAGIHSVVHHSKNSAGERGMDVVISWKYLGTVKEGKNDPPTNHDHRCETSTLVNPPLPMLEPGAGAKEDFARTLVRPIPPDLDPSWFMCELHRGHEGDEHMRTGTFAPLGIQWIVKWHSEF